LLAYFFIFIMLHSPQLTVTVSGGYYNLILLARDHLILVMHCIAHKTETDR